MITNCTIFISVSYTNLNRTHKQASLDTSDIFTIYVVKGFAEQSPWSTFFIHSSQSKDKIEQNEKDLRWH